MTDIELENKANQYVVESCKTPENVRLFGEILKRTYITAVKENCKSDTIWHDLRKNPNDLPDTDRNVWVKRESENECQIDNYYEDDKGWGIMFREGYCTDDVVAWCELPKYIEYTEEQ
jgi:hypothetical protein